MISCHETAGGERQLRGNTGGEGRQESNRSEEYVGDHCGDKNKMCLRIVTQNINGLGQMQNSLKELNLKSFASNYGVDILGIQETNVCWNKVGQKHAIWDRFRGWKEACKLSVAFNSYESNSQKYQPGGGALITINKLAHKVIGVGVDETKLGRWAWTRYQGTFNRIFRVVSVYRPVVGKEFNSAYMQQYRHSTKYNDGKCPREVLMLDLQKEILEWKELGDSIVVIGDWNEDIRCERLVEFKDRLGLHDVMLEKLGDTVEPPNTYQRGRKPIDTILCTRGIVVEQAGYFPFGEGVGDHRALFIDVTIASTLGVNLPPDKAARARKLKLQDPRIIKKYVRYLKHFFKRHSLSDQAKLLQDRVTCPITQKDAAEYERLDKIRIAGMQYAEKRCRKLKMGGVPWTPALSYIRLGIEVWMLVLKRLRGCSVSSRTILRKKNRANMEATNTNVPAEFAQLAIDKLFVEYKEYLKESLELRQTFQHELAQARAKEGNTKLSVEIDRQERVEAQRLSAARIRRMNGNIRVSQGLSQVITTDDDGVEVTISDKIPMEAALLHEYEANLTQANTTPCMLSPLKDILGPCATGQGAQELLSGNVHSIDGVPNATMEVLKYVALKEGTKLHSVPTPILTSECQAGWRKAKERTSSAMKHGTHFGHWKAGHLDDTIADTHTSLANIPYLTGYSPTRWQHGVNTLIPKEAGNFRVGRLRTILLYEADFNFNNKILGMRMMQEAEKNEILAREQYGSRKKKTAIECALNKRLTFDILRQIKLPAGICSCDLKSCYDRIVHAFASLAMQRAGAPVAAVESMFTTIQQLKHIVRTSFGDSDQSFGGEEWRELCQLQGVGQGNGAGPAIWAVISTVFFDLLRDKGYGFKMKAPLSKLALHMAGCGFVDDTDIMQIGLEDDDYYIVAQKLQEALRWWEVCTKVSGGAIVPEKSWYGLVSFEWVDGEWSYGKNMEDAEVTVKNMQGDATQLKVLDPDEAKKMLGVFLAIDGNNATQVSHMRRIAEEWSDKVRVGHLTRFDAWTAFTTTVMKTLEYPLLALTLTEEECNSIMAPVISGGLSNMGICRAMARSLVYGPIKNQGLGINKLFTTQGILHVRELVNHMWRQTETGKLLQTSIEYAKLEVGTRGSLFKLNYDLFGHLCEETWVKHLWKFIYDSGIEIEDDLKDFTYTREQDSTLSSHFAAAYKGGSITRAEWVKANKCRKYLRVLTVADIASGDGRSLDAGVLKGILQHDRVRDIEWAVQGKPKSTDWGVWRKVLKLSLLNYQGLLRESMGRWVNGVDKIYSTPWKWWWDENTRLLYRLVDNTWHQFRPIVVRRNTRSTIDRFNQYTQLRVPPNTNHLHRTSVTLEKGCYVTHGYRPMQDIIVPQATEETTIKGLVQSLQQRQGETWAVHDVKTSVDIDEIVDDIANGTAVGVSDGSFKDEFGTASWIIENASGSQRIMGNVLVPGFASDQSAYRSEIAGIYGLVMVTEAIKRLWGLEKGEITIGCDGINALYESLDFRYKPTSCNQQQFDLLSGIQGYLRSSTIRYVPEHVKGHQDDNINLEKLGRLALLNIEMDYWAKDYWAEQYDTRKYFSYEVPTGMWKIAMLGTRVCNHLVAYLRDSIEGGKAAEYWVFKRKRFDEEGYFQVDWETNRVAMKSVPIGRRHWVTKFESGMCGTGKMMKLWKKRLVDNCPRCGEKNETPTHILTCKSVTACKAWAKSMIKLEKWLDGNKTCPDISKLLLQVLEQWRSGDNVSGLKDFDFDGVEDIFISQRQIGWRPLLGGCLSLEWAKVQGTYFKWLGVRKTGKRWVAALIQKLWDVSWDQWENRNGALHNTPMAADLSGAVSLNRAISAECHLGIGDLPFKVGQTFPEDINNFLHQPLVERKCWLVLVRTAREAMNDNRIQDEFTDPQSHLRKWVGL